MPIFPSFHIMLKFHLKISGMDFQQLACGFVIFDNISEVL